MKKRKKYIPKPIKINAVFNVIQSVKPLSEDDKLHLFKQALAAINRMQFGGATASDFTVLCDVLNISTLLAAREIGNEYMPFLVDAREALQDSKQRYIKTSKLGFTAIELKAVKSALDVHNAQMEVITYKEFTEAFDIQEAKIKRGDFYHREGDLKVSDRVAA